MKSIQYLFPFRHPGGTSRLPVEGHIPSLSSSTGWLHSEPLTTENLRGKVVLVNFWINPYGTFHLNMQERLPLDGAA